MTEAHWEPRRADHSEGGLCRRDGRAVKMCTALAEDPGSVPRARVRLLTSAYYSRSNASDCPVTGTHMTYTHTDTYIIVIK